MNDNEMTLARARLIVDIGNVICEARNRYYSEGHEERWLEGDDAIHPDDFLAKAIAEHFEVRRRPQAKS